MPRLTDDRRVANVVMHVFQNSSTVILIILDHAVDDFGDLVDQYGQVPGDGEIHQNDQNHVGDQNNDPRWHFRQPALDQSHPFDDQESKDESKEDHVHHRPQTVQNENDSQQNDHSPQKLVGFKAFPGVIHETTSY